MKIPKTTSRYCPKCKTHAEQKISLVSSGHKRGSLRRGGKARVRMRGGWRGHGNLGKYSKKPVGQYKKKTKTTKKTNLLYTCKKCNKSSVQRVGIRTGKLVFEEKEK
ncbi:MAG: 50S ribosomal protein L44e [Nanoarchaeota archaeon]|nr:50S ribosomal protein L44e [Nanoarchaeota archaeon]